MRLLRALLGIGFLVALVAPAAAYADTTPAPSGTTRDGLPVYRLAAGEHPAPVRPTTSTFRAEYHFAYGGADRSFRVFVPPGLRATAPTVLGLHGLYQSSSTAQNGMLFQDIATAKHFVVAYPQGRYSSWNAGSCCGRDATDHVDDVGFLVRVQTYLNDLYPTDTSRRYITGFSNGAMMAARAACARPTTWAAVGVVAGTHVTSCRPAEGSAAAFMNVHGTADTLIPTAGTPYSTYLHSWLRSYASTNAVWRASGAPVKGVLLTGSGHQWPTITGGPGTRYDTTANLWAFFAAHPD